MESSGPGCDAVSLDIWRFDGSRTLKVTAARYLEMSGTSTTRLAHCVCLVLSVVVAVATGDTWRRDWILNTRCAIKICTRLYLPYARVPSTLLHCLIYTDDVIGHQTMKSNLSPVDSCKKTSAASARRGVWSGAFVVFVDAAVRRACSGSL